MEEREAPALPHEQRDAQKDSAGISFLPCQSHDIYDFSLVQLSDWSEHVSELFSFSLSKTNAAQKREGAMAQHSKVYVKQDQEKKQQL